MTITTKCFSTLLALTLGAGAATAQTTALDKWMAAPGASERFKYQATGFDSVNQFLAASLATMSYPDLLGVPGYVNGVSAHEVAYRTNLAAVLGKGTAEYKSTSTEHAGWGYDRVTHIYDAGKDAEAFIASNENYAVVSIRGSESGDAYSWFKDWIEADVNMVPVYLGGTKIVHAGFWMHAQAIVAHAVPQLRNSHDFQPYVLRYYRDWGWRYVRNPKANRPIWLTGHSLGGAAGVLAAYILKTVHGFNVKGAYTIGQPTCANAGFAAAYSAAGLQLHRAVNCSDFVARCFADLDELPLEHDGIQARVALKIAEHWPWPFDVYLQGLVIKFFTPTILADFGFAVLGKAAQGIGFRPTHFGTLTYFDRNGVYRQGWNGVQRFNDRVISHSDDVLEALDPFLFPKPPTPWAGSSAWRLYYERLQEQKDKLIAALKDPKSVFDKFASAMGRPFADHGAHPYYLRRIYDRTKANVDSMAGLPGRPD